MKNNNDKKIALITGASRGIGRSVAIAFAAKGIKCIVHYHNNKEAADKTLAALEGDGHTAMKADLSDPDQVEKLVADVIGRHHKIDYLINNAGVFEEISLTEVDYKEWQRTWVQTISTNLTGAANLTFLASKEMIRNNIEGKIINISSRGAFRGEPDAPAYGASKSGLNSFGQSMAKALAPQGIKVFTIAPGFVDTDMAAYAMVGPRADEIRNQSPLQRIARPDEIADLAVYLATGNTDYMTGCIIDVNGASYLRS